MKAYLFDEMYEMEETYWWHKAKRYLVKKLLRKYLGNLKDKEILDVGFGTGYFLKELSRESKAYGLDKSRKCLEFAKMRGLKNISLFNIEKSSFTKPRFDAAASLDVIEHIKNDKKAMWNINKSLRPGGILIVAVPAFQSLWTYWDEAAGHQRRYSKKTMVDLFESSGFKVEFVSFTNVLPFVPAYLLRIMKNKSSRKARKNTSDFIRFPYIINNLFFQIMRLEIFVSFLVPPPFGLSLVVVGRKIKANE